ncbi:hypothetical protein HMPREF2954_08760 [Neisseria sp. HMSC067H09]|nr:hypothetical protein HMPREF2954_08760 [Neisseria sp. HMSC067H09]
MMLGYNDMPAAFRRLCVETGKNYQCVCRPKPAAFRRLCVETQSTHGASQTPNQLPSGGCVLKLNEALKRAYINDASRLQAVVC